MNIQSKWLALALLAACIALPASAAWFSGGSYDGYDRSGEGPALDWPQVNNASGATNVTGSSAWLNGMLIYTGSAPATVTVYWGKTDGLTDPNAWDESYSLGQPAERVPLSHQASLDQGSVYFYRFHAINTASPPEEGWAATSETFVTLSPPVVSLAAGASPVGRLSATLNGALTAGLSAEVTIYWGTDPGAWSHTNSLGTLDEGAFSILLSDLSPGTTYGYQISVENTYGADQTLVEWFETLSGTALFSGGSYDGYDRFAAASDLSSSGGTVIMFR